MTKWKVPDTVVPTDTEMAASNDYDKLRHAVELALAELDRRVNCTTARDRARKILRKAMG